MYFVNRYRAAIRDVHRQIPEITVTQASPESEDTPSPLARSSGQVLSQLRRYNFSEIFHDFDANVRTLFLQKN